MRLPINASKIPQADKNPTVLLLLEIIQKQAEEIQLLKDEIARLKGQSPRPKIRPSKLESGKKGKSKNTGNKKRPGSNKRNKTKKLEIHETEIMEPEDIPVGSTFKGYNDFIVQGLKVHAHNTRYRLKTYEAPNGQYIAGKLPENINNKHYSPELIRYILYQCYHAQVTQPILLEQLNEFGVDISSGQLNNILIEGKDVFHQEKDAILSAGLEASSYINVDDTGARHKGKNGYCTYIGNESFAWFESTGSKSRINFLKLMSAGNSDYLINTDAIAYMTINKLPKKATETIVTNLGAYFITDDQWDDFLLINGIIDPRHIQIATEGALIGSIVEQGINSHLVIVSDDAGQFNVLMHALCWIHAERAINKIVPFSDQAKEDLNNVRDQIWTLYEALKNYKENPTEKDKKRLEASFDEIFSQKTQSATLNAALKRIYNNKKELLLVLDRPDIPLHNNSAENGIREYVKKRKISGSTRSETGRRCRDTFTSLKKTCRKLGISFWEYLIDRICNFSEVPKLADLVRQRLLNPG